MNETVFHMEAAIEKIKEYYFSTGDPSLSRDQRQANFHSLYRKKIGMSVQWNALIEDLNKNLAPLQIRDYGYHQDGPCFRCQIKSNSQKGIFILLSVLLPYFGFYYCSFDETATPDLSIYGIDGGIAVPSISYKAFNSAMVDLEENCADLIRKHFPGHTALPPDWKTVKLHHIPINGVLYSNVDLFQLMFTTNMHSLL